MKQLLRYFDGYKKQAVLGPLFKLTESVMELFMPIIITALINNYAGTTTYFMGHALHLKTWQCAVYLGVQVCFGYICALLCQYYASVASMGFGANIRQAMFESINAMPVSEVDRIGHNSICSRITSDVSQMQNAVAFFIRLVFRAPVHAVGAVVMAFAINVRMGLVFLALVPTALIIIVVIMRVVIPRYKSLQGNLDDIAKTVVENTDGVRIVRAYNSEAAEEENMHRATQNYFNKGVQASNTSALTSPTTSMLVNVGVAVVIAVGAAQVNKGNMSGGDISAFTTYLSWILMAFTILANLVITFSKAFAGAERVLEVLNAGKDAAEAQNARTSGAAEACNLPAAAGDKEFGDCVVEFENVCFGYDGNDVVHNLNFKIKRGEKVGVIGCTGSGKTTIINLIVGFIKKTSGTIRIFGKPIEEVTFEQLRKAFSVCFQHFTLFEGTVKDNLLFGNGDASEAELWDALAVAAADDYVRGYDEGLMHGIVQGAGNVSGGQKQRLALARSVLHGGEVLVLDDCTSNLDFATEAKILKRISASDKTVLLTSQRISAVRHMQRILLVDGGVIVAEGTHAEMLVNPTYRRIYDLQTKEDAK